MKSVPNSEVLCSIQPSSVTFLRTPSLLVKTRIFFNCYDASDLRGFSVRSVSWDKDFKAVPGVGFVEQGLFLAVFVQVLGTQMAFNK